MTMAKAALPLAMALAACAPRDPRCQIELLDAGHLVQCTIGQPFECYAYVPHHNVCYQPGGCECDAVCESAMFETLEECERVCVETWP